MNSVNLKSSYNGHRTAKTPGFSSYDELFGKFYSRLDKANPSKNFTSPYHKKFVNPEKPKGQLVKGSILLNPVKEVTEGVKTFGKALKGQGDDFSLGKLNDTAIFLGAVSIAAMLGSAQKTLHGKAMEFIGAATFLGAMTVWPRLIIGKPLKALTGVDLSLEYKTADGKQKPFFRDPQYIPWDLMDKETLEKAGKKLNVPEDIENREEEIKKRMTKVATGTNTWWMLSAGLATPFISSLVADAARKPAERIINTSRVVASEANMAAAGMDTGSKNPLSAAGKYAAKLISGVKDAVFGTGEKKLNTLIETGDTKKVNEFLERKFRGSMLFETITNKVHDAVKAGTEDGKLTSEAKKTVRTIYSDARKAVKAERTWNGFFRSTMEFRWGTDRNKTIKQLLKSLGIEGQALKELAETQDPIKRSKIIARRIKEIYTAGNTEQTIRRIEQIINKPLEKAQRSGSILERAAQGLKSAFTNNTFASEMRQVGDNLANRADDKTVNITTSLKISNILNYGKESVDELARIVRRLDDNDAWNRLTKKDSLSEIKQGLKKIYGEGAPVIKKITTFLKSGAGEQNKNSSRLIEWLGESPANMFHNAAKETKGYADWFRKIGLKSFLPLVVITGATIGLITLNARRNDKVKGN